MAKTSVVFNKINQLRERYYKTSTGKEALIKLISEAEITDQVYNSNAIENSTLSLEETEKILLQIDLDRYITEREIFETKNLAHVVSYIEKKAKEQELNLDVILSLHKMLISNIRDDIAGRFRKDDERVRVGSHIAPAPKEILERLEKMLREYNESSHENNIDRKKYYDAFKEFDEKGATAIMEEIVAKALTNSYHKRLAYLEGKKIVTLVEYAKKNKSSHSNLINKANRQTIEAFLEKGVWKIGVV